MNKGNKRLFFYIITFLLFLIFTIIGYLLYNSGYGKYGQIKEELTPIINTFNNLNLVKNNTDTIKAKLNKDRLKITYINYEKKYVFYANYNKTADLRLLELEYDVNNSSVGEFIGSLLLDSISILNNNKEGELFNTIVFDDLYKVNSLQGASLSIRGNTVNLIINIDTNLLQNIKDLNLTDVEIKFITSNDIDNLNNVLNDHKNFNYIKKDIILEIINTNDKYVIYCSNNEENYDDIFESILSSISILSPIVYDDIIKNNYNINLGFETNTYKLEVNPNIDKSNLIANGKYLMKLTLNK